MQSIEVQNSLFTGKTAGGKEEARNKRRMFKTERKHTNSANSGCGTKEMEEENRSEWEGLRVERKIEYDASPRVSDCREIKKKIGAPSI